MAISPLSISERARGCLLGLAVGNALGLPAELLGTAEAIRERFPGGLTGIISRDTSSSPWDGDTALAVATAESLLAHPGDLREMTRRWLEWKNTDGRGIGDWTRRALDHVAVHDAPPAETGGTASNGCLSRSLPVALATLASPRNLVSGTWHVARLLHPDEHCAWSAVAVNIAVARFLLGHRDFVPDVIEALRTNEAPEDLIEVVRQVPLRRQEELTVVREPPGHVLHTVEVALWFAWHEPKLERGLIWIANAGGDTDTNAAVAGALMGARDGENAIPGRWLSGIRNPDRIAGLADGLVGNQGVGSRE